MNAAYFAEAVLAATVVSSLTDWFFFGVLFHARYQAYPEVWRREFSGGNEWKAVLMATIVSVVMACAFLYLLHRLGLHGYVQPLQLAVAIWLIAALPATVTNFIFIKLHPGILVSHSLGWLLRLAVFAASFAAILDR
ncbi:MAG TPA: DUF1761 domain-containing protein [Candidatus Acidoferrales bacterium]|nr:DUF1761 domain-containing protein [Candidatus Acidoferrales bacterium]